MEYITNIGILSSFILTKTLLDILSVKDTERIEYTRTDAFIEKACEWLENNLQGIVGGSIYIEDFRKYMEGEKV